MRRCVGTVLLVVALLCSLIRQFTVPRLRGGWAVVMSWGIKDLSKRPMDQNYHEHIDIRQLTEQFDGLNLGLNSIFKRITCDLRELHEENAALQRRIGQYEDTEWLHIQVCFQSHLPLEPEHTKLQIIFCLSTARRPSRQISWDMRANNLYNKGFTEEKGDAPACAPEPDWDRGT